MVHLTRIYTKTGDDGQTSTATNHRIDKASELIEAIGSIDEANSAIEWQLNIIMILWIEFKAIYLI